MGLMGSATLPTGESSGLIGENRSSHHLNKLLLGGFIIDGPVGLTAGFVAWTVPLVGLIRGPLVVVVLICSPELLGVVFVEELV